MRSTFLVWVSLVLAAPAFGQFHKAPDRVKVSDVQGIVSVKSPMASRWSIAQPGLTLGDGDRIRTGARGANAVRLVSKRGIILILGPNSILEFNKNGEGRLLKGEIEINPHDKKSNYFLLSPGEQQIRKQSVWRAVEKDAGEIILTKLKNTPLWLTGFKEINTTETMGSLIAKVDGRDVPLTVGYHHVTVEIRDQIARTTIEQSFVNHTGSRTEGVFYFPLPQEASIAGFGMWINGEYVEADVVEKQRAREIYETILRERRDPALLEWTGGNLFKARVFPILPHSEKRVKIVYTEVLPLDRYGLFRYRYALRSDLTRQNPIRDLKVDVRVHSALGIKSAICKSHPGFAQVDVTKKAAHIQLAEQEYTPKSDFEITVKPVESESIVTLSPHRRGEDGYFLASIKVPEFPAMERGGPSDQTGLGAGSDPVSLLFLADTSGSIDPTQRRAQRQIIEAALSQLGEKDRFLLAVCDVDCLWWKDEAQLVNDENIGKALDFLDRRFSLGWSDLEKTFTAVKKKKLDPETQIIYLGDGIPATAKSDPNEFADSLKNIFPNFKGIPFKLPLKLPPTFDPKRMTFHAVATGSTFEPVILRTIASLGSGNGTNRQVESSPVKTANDLISDIFASGWNNLQINFEGDLRTARVFPESFSNVKPGEQRFILGRYLPGEGEQTGVVNVTAEIGGNNFEWKIPLSIPVLSDGQGDKGGDTGNSFIPRLWARKYLDELLEQGSAAAIQEEIVSLSEEYKIMTPYTSFLVLESEADRKRFNVIRRFQMRDGERFFSDGREAANFELVQQQMKRAGAWRQNLRAQVLSGMSGMGREPLQVPRSFGSSRFSMIGHGGRRIRRELPLRPSLNMSIPSRIVVATSGRDVSSHMQFGAGVSSDAFSYADKPDEWNFNSLSFIPVTPATPTAFEAKAIDLEAPFLGYVQFGSPIANFNSIDDMILSASSGRSLAGESFISAALSAPDYNLFGIAGVYTNPQFGGIQQTREYNYAARRSVGKGGRFNFTMDFLQNVSPFPHLSPLTLDQEVKSDWPDAPKKLANLLQRDAVFGEGVSHLVSKTTHYDTRRDTISSIRIHRLAVRAKKGEWVSQSSESSYLVFTDGGEWNGVVDKRRFIFDSVTSLGRERDLQKNSDEPQIWRKSDLMVLPDLERFHHRLVPEIVDADKDKETVWLMLKPKDGKYSVRYLIDQKRGVILRKESMAGKRGDKKWRPNWRNTKFVEFRGRQFVKTRERYSREDKVSAKIEYQYAEGNGGLFAAAKSEMDAGIVLDEMPEKLLEASRRVKNGKASKEDWMALFMKQMSTQQWDDGENNLKKFVESAGGEQAKSKSLRWLWFHFFQQSRRHELLRQGLIREAKTIVANVDKTPAALRLARAKKILVLGNSLQPGERIEIIDLLKPAFDFPDKADAWRLADKNWRTRRAGEMDQWQGVTPQERGDWWRDLWKDYDWDIYSLLPRYSDALWNAGNREAFFALAKEQLKRDDLSQQERFSIAQDVASKRGSVGEYKEAAKGMEPFLDFSNFGEYSYRSYLKWLAYSGQTEKVEKTIRDWFQKVVNAKSDELSEIDLERARGAAMRLLESGNYSQVTHPRWEPLLRDMAIACAKEKGKTSVTYKVLNQNQVQKTDGNTQARLAISEFVKEKGSELDLSHLRGIIEYCDLEDGEWIALREQLLERWRGEKDEESRHKTGDFIKNQRSRFFKKDNKGYLVFLRERLVRCTNKSMRQHRRDDIFGALLGDTNGGKAVQDELFELLIEQGSDDEKEQTLRLATQANSLIQLSDWIANSKAFRIQEAEGKEIWEMTRAEREDLIKRIREGSNEAVVRELSAEIARRRADEKWSQLLPWMELELVHFQARQPDAKPGDLLGLCLDWLGDTPADWSGIESPIEMVRLSRVFETALSLAAIHFEKEPELVGRLETFIDKGLSLDDPDRAASWMMQKWRLLVAKNESAALEKSLRQWIAADEFNPVWRLALGYLLAETDRLKLAVIEFQKLEEDKQLSAQDAVALSGWLQVLGRKNAYQGTLVNARDRAAEQQLSRAMQGIKNRVKSRNGGPTGKLEEKDIKTITELFQRCQSSQSYLYQLSNLYQETKDPRLPGCLVGGLMGRSAQEIYPALQRFFDVTRYIEEESSVDEAMKQIGKLRKEKLTQSNTDERALDLIEAELKRRASEVLNQPDQHIARAIAALKRAMGRKFESGERQMMAQWLHLYGAPSSDELRKEIFRAFARLYDGEVDVFQKLGIVNQWAQLEVNRWNPFEVSRWDPFEVAKIRNAKSADLLQVALEQARSLRGGKFTQEMQQAFFTLIRSYQGNKKYAAAEKLIRSNMGLAANPSTRSKLVEMAFDNYRDALRSGASTSFGSGMAQYKGAREWMLRELMDERNASEMGDLIGLFGDYHIEAHKKKIPSVGSDLEEFGKLVLPKIIENHQPNINRVVSSFAQKMKSILGPIKAMEFSLTMIETEPVWVSQETGSGIWHIHGYHVLQWRKDLGKLPDKLENRLLTVTKKILWTNLEFHNHSHLRFADLSDSRSWDEKSDDYCQVAENYLEKYSDSPLAVVNAARFFYNFPEKKNRACDLLLALHKEKKLQENDQILLGEYLGHTKRWKESRKIHTELVKNAPVNFENHRRLIRSLFHIKKPKAMMEAIKSARSAIEKNHRRESDLRIIAAIALEVEEFTLAVELYKEAIRKHEATQANRGIGEGTVSGYYREIAKAFSSQGKTKEAVDAASAAIVAWGPKKYQRTQAVDRLRKVISEAKNIDAFARQLDAEAEEGGLEKPIVRKQLGRVFLENEKRPKDAVKQFRIAVETQANDGETHRLLVRALDKSGDTNAARDQLIESIRLAPRDLELIRDLGKRFAKAENSAGTERAFTNLVEAMPNEAEGHHELAKIRHEQNRWDEAISHWEQVAEFRKLEPTGLIGEIRTELAADRIEAARTTLVKLNEKKWPDRFRGEIQQVQKLFKGK